MTASRLHLSQQPKGITRRQFLLAGGSTLATAGCFRQICKSGPELALPVKGASIEPPPLCQFAFSVVNLDRTRGWYRDMLGFVPSGGTNDFGNPFGSWVQGLPNVDVVCKWMVDQQDFLQLEMFEFKSPVPKPRPKDWGPHVSGYTVTGFHVSNFDERLRSLRSAGVQTLTEAPIGAPGSRRIGIRDPEGNIVELMEDDPRQSKPRPRPRSTVPVVARSITVSVTDIDRSKRFFLDTLRLEECT